MYSSEDLEHFRLSMSIASLLELCHTRVIAACADKPGVCATSVLATSLYTIF